MGHAGIVKALKIAGWTLVAVVVVMAVMLFCAVKFLESRYLAPMIERVADDYIDGDVRLGSLRLGFRPRFPILGIEVEDLSVISHAFDSLTDGQRGLLPNYADSLLTLEHLSGAVDIKRLLMDNEVSLHDVTLSGLSVNLVIAHDGKANYDILKLPTDTADTSGKRTMPGFRIDRFALTSPKEIRFYNAADSVAASVLMLTDAAVDGGQQPTYRLKVSGNVTSPQATLLTNLENISFGLNGKVYWNPTRPGLVAMDEMELQGAFLKAVVSGEIDLTESPIVKKGSVDLKPVAVADLITLLPDSIRREHRFYAPYFHTDAAISGRVELTAPMNLATDTIPTARITVSVSPSSLDYGDAHLTGLALDVAVNTLTNQPDSITVDIGKFTVNGPGTSLEADAKLSRLISDPTFDVGVDGRVDFRDFPPILLEMIPGYLSGKVTADLRAKGSTSMFRPERLHHLVADGMVAAKGIYFLTADTSKLVQVGNATINLDSKRMVEGMPLLNAKVEVDTATILVSGVDLALGSVSLNAGVVGQGRGVAPTDTTRMMPIDGDLKVARFNITALKDSAGARIRGISGPVRVRGLKSNGRMPEFSTDLTIRSVSAGTLSDRVVLDDTKVKASLFRMASVSGKAKGKDSRDKDTKSSKTGKVCGYLSPSAVYRYVYNKRKHGKHIKRVYGATGKHDDEILVWNLTEQFRRFLNEWKLWGSVDNRHARLLTPLFPLKNRISAVSLKFNNDTVAISDISLRAGNSDLAISGQVTNVRRALTSASHDNLKINLSILSDTIDVNELSASVFTGASYAADKRQGKQKKVVAKDDRSLEEKLSQLSKAGPGRAAPVLIPVNIDGNLRIAANNVLYSDLGMQDMGGDILVYDGGVNVHDLNAYSKAGNLSLSALYSAPRASDMHFGFGMELKDFDISKFVKLVPAIDSITPLMHDFSGMVGADIAATCRLDSGMNIDLPSLDAAIRIQGDNLAFIDPEKYRTLGKWLGFKDKADNTIHSLNVEMTVEEGVLRVYPFAFDIDRYRLGVYGSNDLAMNFNYHLSVLKSPLPFKFGVTISGNPKKYKVRFGGAKFSETDVVQSTDMVNKARINLMDEIQGVFRRGVRNSRFARLHIARPAGFEDMPGGGLSAADSLRLIKEGILPGPGVVEAGVPEKPKKKEGKLRTFFTDLWDKTKSLWHKVF